MQPIVLHFLISCQDTPLLDCLWHIFHRSFLKLRLHTNKRRPCSSTLSGHPSSSYLSPFVKTCQVSCSFRRTTFGLVKHSMQARSCHILPHTSHTTNFVQTTGPSLDIFGWRFRFGKDGNVSGRLSASGCPWRGSKILPFCWFRSESNKSWEIAIWCSMLSVSDVDVYVVHWCSSHRKQDHRKL